MSHPAPSPGFLWTREITTRREWYRYHRFFADFLRTELAPGRSATLHLRAAHWFETHHLLPEAVNHVLAHAAATGDTDKAMRVITLASSRALSEGALVTLLDRLDALPDDVVRASRWLASFKAWCLLMTGQSEMAMSHIQSAEASLEHGASLVDRGRVISLRCAVSPTPIPNLGMTHPPPVCYTVGVYSTHRRIYGWENTTSLAPRVLGQK